MIRQRLISEWKELLQLPESQQTLEQGMGYTISIALIRGLGATFDFGYIYQYWQLQWF